MTIKKCTNYKLYDSNTTDPSHVFVDMVKNYTRPGTPDHNPNIIHHKDIGTRLLQIAQRRSDESLCNGEMKLIAKDVVLKDWYIDVLGMKQEFIPTPSRFKIVINNPNQLYLPPEAKEPLSKLRGGL